MPHSNALSFGEHLEVNGNRLEKLMHSTSLSGDSVKMVHSMMERVEFYKFRLCYSITCNVLTFVKEGTWVKVAPLAGRGSTPWLVCELGETAGTVSHQQSEERTGFLGFRRH